MTDLELLNALQQRGILGADQAAALKKDMVLSSRSLEDILYERRVADDGKIAEIKSELLGSGTLCHGDHLSHQKKLLAQINFLVRFQVQSFDAAFFYNFVLIFRSQAHKKRVFWHRFFVFYKSYFHAYIIYIF